MNKVPHTLLLATLLAAGSALAAEGKVTISAPADGATISSTSPTKLSYEAVPGPTGNHLHLNVDGKRVDVIHELKGTTEFGPLPPGKHQVCLAINTSSHVPTGVEGCVNVVSK
ncbi:MAG TPA: hypothetical protein VMT94_05620 [Burkholderiales bacterium]|nr:hypothetical protein [Burkholderiales bacterium]